MNLPLDARKEEEIFSELSELCSEKGYIHVIAFFCFRDNFIKYSDKLKPEDSLKFRRSESLIRTEISTLLGLLIKNDIDYSLPSLSDFADMAEKTEALLAEVHSAMMSPVVSKFHEVIRSGKKENPVEQGGMLREAIFYAGESAYMFQYRDLFEKKYGKDDEWFVNNKGYSVYDVKSIVSAISSNQNKKITEVLDNFSEQKESSWNILPAFSLSVEEIAKNSGKNKKIVQFFLDSFSLNLSESNEGFETISHFNIVNAYPIIRINDDEYILLQQYSLFEALYETPFYWLNEDKTYSKIAMRNRGEFTEKFSLECLERVFGNEKIFPNINIGKTVKNKGGEIDVLVAYADRAIIVQAKSKKLTIESRKGNDQCIKEDFAKSVAHSYSQGLNCAKLLNDEDYILFDNDNNELSIKRKFKEIYIFCVVSDSYPSLTFQVDQFLQFQELDTIGPPFIMDVFMLDVMTEMLKSPLYFLSYVNRRTGYSDYVISSLELTILSYHLKYNLYLQKGYDLITLDEDFTYDLDTAMFVRRDGLDGNDTPEGILTNNLGKPTDRIIKQIEELTIPGTIDLGFFLLKFSQETFNQLNQAITKLSSLSQKDGNHHDLSLFFDEQSSGLTIHCNYFSFAVAHDRLGRYCRKRKYKQRAYSWFGILIDPNTGLMKLGIALRYDWEFSHEMELMTKDLKAGQKNINFNFDNAFIPKVGRNSPCPCGSDKKYKKCCLK